MKATILLRNDHENLLTLLEQGINPARGNDAQFQRIRDEIVLHSRIEEELFYSELENTSSARAHMLVNTAVAQHREIEQLLNEMAPQFSARKFDQQMGLLLEKLKAHLQFEEEEIFEEARQYLSEYRMEELGLEMEDRRRFLRLSAA